MKTWWLYSLIFFSTTLSAQNVISGKIVDAETAKPVPFASVGVVGTSKGTSSNAQGEFSLRVLEGESIKVTCIGYQSVTVSSGSHTMLIELKPVVTQLRELIVFNKEVNPTKIVKRALSNVSTNYDTHSFAQTFFYRHYCKDDSVYGRLIEAWVEVWKDNGYRQFRNGAGDAEAIRVTQLRRSLDKTVASQGHIPIAINSILQADVAAYQNEQPSAHLSLYRGQSNFKADFTKYHFEFEAITNYDDEEVYQISYRSEKDSILTNHGWKPAPQASGLLYITTDKLAILKVEDVKADGSDTLKTTAYYRKYNGKFYPYHLVLEGQDLSTDKSAHWYHIELMSVEINTMPGLKFAGQQPDKEALLNIPYDSVFWSHNTILKTTPLEDEIIADLGGGQSLDRQFLLYRQYELNLRDGGNQGPEKFAWYKGECKGQRPMYVAFWSSQNTRDLYELEYFKRLNQRYRGQIAFVLLSLDDDEAKWKETMTRFSLFVDGIANFRMGTSSAFGKEFKVREAPRYFLFGSNGAILEDNARKPNDPLLEDQLRQLAGGIAKH